MLFHNNHILRRGQISVHATRDSDERIRQGNQYVQQMRCGQMEVVAHPVLVAEIPVSHLLEID